MIDIPLSVIFNFFLFLLLPFVFAVAAKKLRISPVVGYIIGGLIVGNFLFDGISPGIINNFAYFGIVLLLFTVGLETNLTQIIVLKKYIVLGGTLQLLLTICAVMVTGLLFHFSLLESFLIGIAFSSSSTTLVAKIIQDRGEEGSFVGELAMGILIFQDIAFIPYLIIFTSITSRTISLFPVTLNIVKSLFEATIIITVLFYLGQKTVPYVFNRIARASRELFNLFIVLFIFFIISLSLILKIPILIGVFVAGVLLAQTIEHYHIFSEMRPFRDLLAIIFFVYIGTNIKLPLIIGLMPQILAFTLVVMFIKAAIILAIFLLLRFHSKTAFSLSLYLFQIDEAAFILMSTAYINKVISLENYLFVITSVLLTIVLTPILIESKDRLYKTIRNITKKYLPFMEYFISHRIDRDQSPIDTLQIKNHIVICGYGRVGSYIGRSLMMANIPFVAIDYNFQIVEKAKKEGVTIIYGDPSDFDILDYAEVEHALMIILAVPAKLDQETIVMNAKKLNPKIFIISRVHKETDQRRMKDLGVHYVVQPEFEASLSIIKKIYLLHKLSKDDIINKIRRLKIEHGLS